MTTILDVDGPKWGARQLRARIIIRRNRMTVSVYWDIGTIDLSEPASDEFRRRLNQMGFPERVVEISRKSKRSRVYGGEFYGSARLLDCETAKEVSDYVFETFTKAAKGLSIVRQP